MAAVGTSPLRLLLRCPWTHFVCVGDAPLPHVEGSKWRRTAIASAECVHDCLCEGVRDAARVFAGRGVGGLPPKFWWRGVSV